MDTSLKRQVCLCLFVSGFVLGCLPQGSHDRAPLVFGVGDLLWVDLWILVSGRRAVARRQNFESNEFMFGSA